MPNKYSIIFSSSLDAFINQQIINSSIENNVLEASLDEDSFTLKTSQYDAPSSFIDSNIDQLSSSVIYPIEKYANYLLYNRIAQLDREFTPQLLRIMKETPFEYGINSDIDLFIHELISVNCAATMFWLNNVFLKNYSNPIIIVGLLRIIARLNYEDIAPIGPTIAMAAIPHKNARVQECAIRAIEAWADVSKLPILMTLKVQIPWLQDYINKVIIYLQKINGSIIGTQNR